MAFYNFQNCPFSKSEVQMYCKRLGMEVPVPKTLADVEFIQNANCRYDPLIQPKYHNGIINVSTGY